MSKQVKLNDKTNEQLTKMSDLRKASGELVKSKQDIVAMLVDKQFKKEYK